MYFTSLLALAVGVQAVAIEQRWSWPGQSWHNNPDASSYCSSIAPATTCTTVTVSSTTTVTSPTTITATITNDPSTNTATITTTQVNTASTTSYVCGTATLLNKRAALAAAEPNETPAETATSPALFTPVAMPLQLVKKSWPNSPNGGNGANGGRGNCVTRTTVVQPTSTYTPPATTACSNPPKCFQGSDCTQIRSACSTINTSTYTITNTATALVSVISVPTMTATATVTPSPVTITSTATAVTTTTMTRLAMTYPDFFHDSKNCGGCGIVCPTGTTCQAHSCQ